MNRKYKCKFRNENYEIKCEIEIIDVNVKLIKNLNMNKL
jgi:hypothetical protein